MTVWPLFKWNVDYIPTLTLTLTPTLTPNQVWPLFKWNVDYIIIGYLARETQALTPNP